MQILVVDDHPLFLDALTLCVERAFDGAEVVNCRDLATALAALESRQAQLCILDYQLPDSTGEVSLARIRERWPDMPVAVVSGLRDAARARAMIEAGARGFLPKDLEPDMLNLALKLIVGGGSFVPPDLMMAAAAAGAMADAAGPGTVARMADAGDTAIAELAQAGSDAAVARSGSGVVLTPREADVLKGLVAGQSNKEIARALDLQEITVKLHVRRILKKLGANNRVQAVRAAVRVGLIDAEQLAQQ